MNMPPPTQLRVGDYTMNFPVERPGDRQTARDVMRRNGCKTIRFEMHEAVSEEVAGMLIAHGYVAKLSGNEVEAL